MTHYLQAANLRLGSVLLTFFADSANICVCWMNALMFRLLERRWTVETRR